MNIAFAVYIAMHNRGFHDAAEHFGLRARDYTPKQLEQRLQAFQK